MNDRNEKSRRTFARVFPLVALVVFIVVFYLLFKKHQFNFRELFALPWTVLLSMVGLIFLTFLVRGLIVKTLVSNFGVKLSFYEWYGLSVFRKYLNYLPLKSGTIAKGLYLKKCHNLPIALFVSVIGGFFVLFLLSNGVLGLLCWLVAGRQGTEMEFIIPLAFIAFILLGVIFFFYSPDLSKKKGFIFGRLEKMYQGWELIRKDRRTVVRITFLSLMTTAVYAVRLMILFRWQSVGISFFQAIMVAVLINLVTIFINVTPSALGIKEAVLIYTSSLMGFGIEACLYVAAIDRLIAVSVTLGLGPIAGYVFGKKIGLEIPED